VVKYIPMKRFLVFAAAVVLLSGAALALSPGSTDLKKAVLLIKKEKYQQAVDLLAPLAADERYILNDHAAFKLATALEDSGNREGAEEEYRQIISDFPCSVLTGKSYQRLGRLCAARGDLAGAAAAFNSSLSCDIWKFSKDAADSAARALSSIKSSPDDTADSIWKEGFSLYKNGDRLEAFDKFGQCPDEADPRLVAKCVYWRAKSAQKAGMPYEAEKLLEYLAGYYPYTYYGMRACQTLDQKVPSVPASGLVLPELSEFSAGDVHFEKFRELAGLGLFEEAKTEAAAMVSFSQDAALSRLGKLCLSLAQNAQKNYRHSIKTLEAQREWDFYSTDIDPEKYLAMNLAYPKAFKDQVFIFSRKYGVDPYLMFALIREESRFDPKAVSRAKARGLSQIMPRTGRGLAKKLELRPYRASSLSNPALNIRMGVYYLSLLLKRFGGDKHLALASYNGGAGNVDKWLSGLEYSDIDEFVENIPFKETKLYVKKVLESYWQYKRLYEGG